MNAKRLLLVVCIIAAVQIPVFSAVRGQGTAGSSVIQAPVIAYLGATGDVSVTSMGVNPGPVRLSGDAGRKPSTETPFHAQDVYYTDLRWSPDGSMLLFATPQGNLYMARSGEPARQIGSSLAPLPPVWSVDGKEIAYGIPSVAPDQPTMMVVQVQAIPAVGGPPRFATQFQMDCSAGGIGVYEPSAVLYLTEMGANNGDATTLDWAATGFVHSTNCLGSGLALSDSSGNTLWTIPNVYHVAVSPDRTRAVALQGNSDQQSNQRVGSPVLIDLASGAVTPLITQPGADQFGWTADGLTILYSTTAVLAQVDGDPSATLGKQLFFNWPLSVQSYNVSLWRVPSLGGDSTLLFSQEGRAIGHIVASPSTPVAAFSFITSGAPLIKAINAGNALQAVLSVAPTVKIGVTTLNPAQGAQAGFPHFFDGDYSGQPAFSSASAFTAVAAPGTFAVATPVPSVPTAVRPPPTLVVQPTLVVIVPTAVPANTDCFNNLPGRLVIGKQGRVLPPDPNSLNSLPARPSGNTGSQRLGIIPVGGVFTVVDGPVCNDGHRWWKVNYNGTVGWTAEGEGNVYWLEPLP